jgi:hypothetical protein
MIRAHHDLRRRHYTDKSDAFSCRAAPVASGVNTEMHLSNLGAAGAAIRELRQK